MGQLTELVESLGKRLGLSSNQLLKCVLLNTAIELFSYIDAPTYSGSVYQYHWNMEDFDHLYTKRCPEVLVASLSSDGITEQTDLQQNTTGNSSSDEPETTSLLMEESLFAQTREEHYLFEDPEHVKAYLDTETLLYWISPVNIWLEFPLSWDEQAAEPSPGIEEYFYFYATDFPVLPASTVLNCSATDNHEVILNTCGVQTDDPLKENYNIKTLNLSHREASYYSFNNDGMDHKPSILWDSYDLHMSSQISYAHPNMSSRWEIKDPESSNIEDILFMEQEMAIKEEQAELYPVCHVIEETDSCFQDTPKNSEVTGEKPVSSTPCTKKTRSRTGVPFQTKGEVHFWKNNFRLDPGDMNRWSIGNHELQRNQFTSPHLLLN